MKKLEDSILHEGRRVHRIRQRKGLTLASETLTALDEVIDRGEATNVSRAIDIVVQFFQKNRLALHAKLESSMHKSFVRKCVKLKKNPDDVLAMLAARWTLEKSE